MHATCLRRGSNRPPKRICLASNSVPRAQLFGTQPAVRPCPVCRSCLGRLNGRVKEAPFRSARRIDGILSMGKSC